MAMLESLLTPEQRAAFTALDSPFKIQSYLDSIPYNGENRNRSPLDVIRDWQCHCYDGGLLGAAALRRLGFRPQILEMWPEPGTDDDHVLAVFKIGTGWGAVAKSNFVGLRFREPVYHSIRELVMSYFEVFYNVDGLKTLRSYTLPINLKRYDSGAWETNESTVDFIEKKLHELRTFPVMLPEQVVLLSKVDERSYQAGLQGTNWDGLYKPQK